MLEKKYSLPEGVEAAPADGSITQNMRDFDSDADRSLASNVCFPWPAHISKAAQADQLGGQDQLEIRRQEPMCTTST